MIDLNQTLATHLAQSLAEEVARLLRPEIARMQSPMIQPALLDVRQAAIYLGRSERAVENMIFDRDLPVVRSGRRVHLNRRDLDQWIEKNTF